MAAVLTAGLLWKASGCLDTLLDLSRLLKVVADLTGEIAPVPRLNHCTRLWQVLSLLKTDLTAKGRTLFEFLFKTFEIPFSFDPYDHPPVSRRHPLVRCQDAQEAEAELSHDVSDFLDRTWPVFQG